MSIIRKAIDKVKFLYFTYELETALYMLEPWEKRLFNTVLLTFVAMSTYTTYVFLPRYTYSVLNYFDIV